MYAKGYDTRHVRCSLFLFGLGCWEKGKRKQAKGLGPNLPLLSYNRPDREGKGREGKQGKMLSCTLLAEQYC